MRTLFVESTQSWAHLMSRRPSMALAPGMATSAMMRSNASLVLASDFIWVMPHTTDTATGPLTKRDTASRIRSSLVITRHHGVAPSSGSSRRSSHPATSTGSRWATSPGAEVVMAPGSCGRGKGFVFLRTKMKLVPFFPHLREH